MRTRARDSVVMDQMGVVKQNMRDDASRERVCDQSYIKQFNIQSVMATLKQHQPISRTDIARLTGMSPTSITRIVTALLNKELIYETSGEQRSGRGRKATNLRVNEDGLYSIGVYLERSMIRLCVMNFEGETLYRCETLVDGECTPEKMAQESRALYDRMPDGIVGAREKIVAVGVCLSGTVNLCKGIASHSFQMDWRNIELGRIFSEAFGMTACIENDVKACLIGEKVRMGIEDGVDTAYLMVGRGIGLAATSGGVMVRGVSNEAGEISRAPIGTLPDGSSDCLAYHLREGAMIRKARESDPSVHSVDAIVWAAGQGQEWAKEIIADFRRHLEITVGLIDGIYNPAKIIVGGEVCRKIYPDIAETMGKPHVRLGDRHEESCMTGAALIAMRCAVIELIGQNIE